jgi:Uma2 family endonuclease
MTKSASQPDTILTLEEYLTYGDDTDTHYELVDGKLVEMPPESLENCDVAMRLLFQLAKFVPLTWLSYKEIEIEVSGQRAKTRLPDLMVLGEECRHALEGKPRGTITRDMPPPLVAIEIVSPGHINEVRDYRYKRSEYAARGIPSYWIVDPQQRKVTVLSLVEGLYEDTIYQSNDKIGCNILPNIQIKVADILETSVT